MDFDAPDACPGALDVYGRLSSVLGYEPETLGKLSRVRGSVVPAASGYRLVLETFESGRRSSRLFEAASCDDLADAAALAIALAMAPPSAPALEPPPMPNAPAPSPTANPTLEAPGTNPVTSGAEAWRARGFAAASVVLEYGALPGPAPGVAIDGGVRLGSFSLGAYGVLLGTQVQQVAPAQNVQFSVWFAGVRGCSLLLERRLELEACASLEAGRLSALGLDLQPARSSDDPWLAAGGALAARWPFTGSLGRTACRADATDDAEGIHCEWKRSGARAGRAEHAPRSRSDAAGRLTSA